MMSESKKLMRAACLRFNPSEVAIPLAWHEPKMGMYYVFGIFPLAQAALDGHYALAARLDDRKIHRAGSGPSIAAALDALDEAMFGGL